MLIIFRLQGKKVLLIDSTPPQGSSLGWASARYYEDSFPVVDLPKPTLHKDVKKFINDYDYIFIDGVPRSYDVARSALLASNFVLIPAQASLYNILALKVLLLAKLLYSNCSLKLLSKTIGKTLF